MLITQVERYVSLRQALGYKLRNTSGNLRAFAQFAAERGDTHVRVSTALDWATEAPSPNARHIRLRDVTRLRCNEELLLFEWTLSVSPST